MLREVLKPGRLIAGGLLLAAGGALLAIGCTLGTLGGLTLSDISFVPHAGARSVLKMGIEGHGKRGVECIDCHEGAKKEDRAGLPERDFCQICHEEIEEHKDKHALGGPIFDAEGRPKWTVVSLPEGVIFSHAKHTETLDCAECHGDIEHDQYSLVDLAVSFQNCRRCHLDEVSYGECTYCHSTLDENSLPHSHDSRWRRSHGLEVRDGVRMNGGSDQVDGTCSSCHSNSYCVSCHREEKPRDHTIFFTRAGHGLAADIDRERCAACHTEDRCVRCHRDGTTPRPPGHPAVSNCVSCHSFVRGHIVLTDNCLLCHR